MSLMGEMIKVEDLPAYLARPSGEVKAAILVIHEVWGLTEHIKSVADRLANEGYLALAPDFLAGSGINVGKLAGLQEDLFNPEKRNETQPKLRKLMTPMQNPEFGKRALANTKKCFSYLYDLPEAKQKVAVIGFCFGGTYAYSLAVNEPQLALAIPFYGHCDFSISELAEIKCPVRAFYGQNDEGLGAQIEKLPNSMELAEVDFEQKIYSNSSHAFFNDTNRFAYNGKAAGEAWQVVKSELSKLSD